MYLRGGKLEFEGVEEVEKWDVYVFWIFRNVVGFIKVLGEF